MKKRKGVRLPVQVKILEESGYFNFSFAYGMNISSQGMAIEPKIIFCQKKEVSEGSQLKLKFKLPGGKYFLALAAEVVWIKGKEDQQSYGLRFIDPPQDFISDFSRYQGSLK